MLAYAALEPGDTFSRKELADATRLLPAEGLHETAKALVRALEGAGEQHHEYWRNRILPYLKSIWPKSRNIITQPISEELARLCVAAKDAFPEALRYLKHWFQPHEYPYFVIKLLHDANLCERFPEEALDFLGTVINTESRTHPGDLDQCLDSIRNSKPDLETDDLFQRLLEFFRRVEMN